MSQETRYVWKRGGGRGVDLGVIQNPGIIIEYVSFKPFMAVVA